jgi:hypothetical protein
MASDDGKVDPIPLWLDCDPGQYLVPLTPGVSSLLTRVSGHDVCEEGASSAK